jgi:hypothetical protein
MLVKICQIQVHPTTTTTIKIVEPRHKSYEADKNEHKKRGNKLLKNYEKFCPRYRG